MAHESIGQVLHQIIDEWYERVAPHYITAEKLSGELGVATEEELKRFHDEKGHRIKFNKDELDFTYGLMSSWKDPHCCIEVSANNKVENFDYADFQEKLFSHYENTGGKSVPTPYQLRNHCYQDIFQLEPSPQEAFVVEQHQDKADIMRLSFQVGEELAKSLAAHPVSGKQLIEDYCVSPFRTIYAKVYRRSSV